MCDKLWDITDTRRDQAEQERQRIINDQWLEDHVGLLTNHFISVMQVSGEYIRQKYTLCHVRYIVSCDLYCRLSWIDSTILLCYSRTIILELKVHAVCGLTNNNIYEITQWLISMHFFIFSPAEKVPSKLPDPGRIPLINLPPTEAQDDPGSATGSTHEVAADSRPAERGVDSVTERGSDARKDSPTKRWIKCTCTVMHIHDFVQLLTCMYMYMYTKGFSMDP